MLCNTENQRQNGCPIAVNNLLLILVELCTFDLILISMFDLYHLKGTKKDDQRGRRRNYHLVCI